MIAALGACKPVDSAPKPSRAPAAKVVGEPVSCILSSQIRNTQVHDDRTIDFELLGGKLYRNTLPYACPRIGFERAFTYETRTSQLCSSDIVYVLEGVGGDLRRGAGCGLGPFVPVELEKK
jgi:hypothetical protein